MSEAADLTSRAGKVDWDLQTYWMVFTEAESGFETAAKLDEKIWR